MTITLPFSNWFYSSSLFKFWFLSSREIFSWWASKTFFYIFL